MLQLGMLGHLLLCGVVLVAGARVSEVGETAMRGTYTATLKRFQKVGSWTAIVLVALV